MFLLQVFKLKIEKLQIQISSQLMNHDTGQGYMDYGGRYLQ